MNGGVFLIVFGLILLGMGGYIGWVGVDTSRYARELQAYAALAVDETAVGQTGYIEGRLSERNPPLVEQMVVYDAYVYGGTRTERSGDDLVTEQVWYETESPSPALWLNVGPDSVRIASGGYNLSNFSTYWRADGPLRKDETIRYEGFVAGDWVVAVGTAVATADDALMLDATAVWGGDFANYLDANQSGSRVALLIGIVLALVGLLVAGIGAYIVS